MIKYIISILCHRGISFTFIELIDFRGKTRNFHRFDFMAPEAEASQKQSLSHQKKHENENWENFEETLINAFKLLPFSFTLTLSLSLSTLLVSPLLKLL